MNSTKPIIPGTMFCILISYHFSTLKIYFRESLGTANPLKVLSLFYS